MTEEKLKKLNALSDKINYLEGVLVELRCAETLLLCAADDEELRNRYLIDPLNDEEDEDLKSRIINYYDNRLAKLRKEFEEA